MKLAIDRTIRIPPYQQIARQIRESIIAGELEEHAPLPSARDIVRMTGVSLATAQRVLNELKTEGLIYSLPGKGSFTAVSKDRIPSLIHIFLPSTKLSFFMEIMNGVYDALQGKSIELKMHSLNTDKLIWNWKTIEELEEAVKNHEAVIFIEEVFDSVRTTCLRAARQIPFVTIEWILDGACSIINDYENSTYNLMSYLNGKKNCKSFLILKGRDYQYNASMKMAGFAAFSKRIGLEEGKNLFYMDTDFDAITAYKSVNNFLKDHELPDAICCANDYEAIGVVGALTENGYLSGKDVQLVGYGDMTDKTTIYFPLTTVKQNLKEMGRRAVEQLLAKAAGEDSSPEEVVLTELIIRKT
ncbi:MAG: hypothetical protein B6241_11240 [Spirochaetaceae bacterium 4572_59]|nr:MAG: hypothetical protein B6241_11240 [Spirochaetaceae bacterium 4572_59]